MKAVKAREQVVKKGEDLLQRARTGEALDKIAQGGSLKLETAKSVTRDDRDHPVQIVRRAFRMPRPGADAPQVQGIELPDGDYVVLKLDGVEDVTADTIREADKQALEGAFLTARQTSDVNMMVEYLHAGADIQIPEDATQ